MEQCKEGCHAGLEYAIGVGCFWQGKYMEATKTEYASALVEKCPAVRKLDPASQRQVTITGFAGRSLFSTDHHDRLKTHRKTYPSSR